MGVLPDWMIERDIKIEPFAPCEPRPGVISYGLSSYGYDLRLGRNYRVAIRSSPRMMDPKRQPAGDEWLTLTDSDTCTIPPNSFALAESLEYLEIPRDVLAICLGKSTYARCGIIVNITPLEPGWRGKVTIEISNTTPRPAVVYSGEGIAQVVFLRGEAPCRTSYDDKRGIYQDQQGLKTAEVRR